MKWTIAGRKIPPFVNGLSIAASARTILCGLLLLGAGKNVIRFSPPLVLTREQADTAVRMFDEALSEVAKARGFE